LRNTAAPWIRRQDPGAQFGFEHLAHLVLALEAKARGQRGIPTAGRSGSFTFKHRAEMTPAALAAPSRHRLL